MKKAAIFILGIALSDITFASDVRSFDLASVKLGMTPEDARSALQAKCMRDQGKFDIPTKPVSNPYAPGKKYSDYLRCKAPSGETSVYLRAIPNGAIVVDRVNYEMPWNNDNVKALRANALAKYGEPTNIVLMGHDPEWCERPQPGVPGGSVCQESEGARLRVTGTKVELYDSIPSSMIWAAQRARETVKPSL